MKKKLLLIISPLVVLLLLGAAGPSTVTVNHDTFVLGFPSTAQFYGANPVPLTALPNTAAFYGANPVPLSALPSIPASQTTGLEPALGNPSTSGYVLSKSTSGVVTWVPQPTPSAQTYGAPGTYPVFEIDLGPGFYDIELKGTITNFNGAPAELVYWHGTSMDNQTQYSFWDSNPSIFFTGQLPGTDDRAYHLANNSISLYEQVGGANHRLNKIIVIPSHINGYQSWMYANNPKLVWTVLRISATSFETDSNGANVWTPIRPVEWIAAPLNP